MINGKRIFITGANGFIGKNLIERLNVTDNEIGVLLRNPLDNPFSENYKIKSFFGNIEDSKFIEEVVLSFKPQIVFHLAANKKRNESNIAESITTNLLGTLNIFEQLVKIKEIESVVSLGTIDEYGSVPVPYYETQVEKPGTAYGLSKLYTTKMAEYFYRTNKLPVKVLRPSITYGPWQGNEMFIPSLINTLLRDEVFAMTKGDQERDFIYITDLINALILISSSKKCDGKVFNIGYGTSYKIKDVAMIIANKLNKTHLLNLGKISYRSGENMEYTVSNQFLKQHLNWMPNIGLNEGLELTIQHFINKN